MSVKGRLKKGTLIVLTPLLLASCYFKTPPKKPYNQNASSETKGIYCSIGNEVTELKLPKEYAFVDKLKEWYDNARDSIRNKNKSVDKIIEKNKSEIHKALSTKTPLLENLNYADEDYTDKTPQVGKSVEKNRENLEALLTGNKKLDISKADIQVYERLKPFMFTVDYLSKACITHQIETSKGKKTIKRMLLEDIFDKNHRSDFYYNLLGQIFVESSGNPKAYNSYGAYGLGQITNIGLKEYNNFVNKHHPKLIIDGKEYKLKTYTLKDMYNPDKNSIVMAVLEDIFDQNYIDKKGNLGQLFGYYSGSLKDPELARAYLKKVLKYAFILRQVDSVLKEVHEEGYKRDYPD